MNLAGAFAESVHRQPQKIALFWGEREYSYAELWRESVLVADQLQHRFDVKPGDRVGLWLKNCPEFIPALFAVHHNIDALKHARALRCGMASRVPAEWPAHGRRSAPRPTPRWQARW